MTVSGILMIFICIVFLSCVITSVVLFIWDGIMAKRQQRPRKRVFTILFIVAMGLLGLAIVIYILLSMLIYAIMRSM